MNWQDRLEATATFFSVHVGVAAMVVCIVGQRRFTERAAFLRRCSLLVRSLKPGSECYCGCHTSIEKGGWWRMALANLERECATVTGTDTAIEAGGTGLQAESWTTSSWHRQRQKHKHRVSREGGWGEREMTELGEKGSQFTHLEQVEWQLNTEQGKWVSALARGRD